MNDTDIEKITTLLEEIRNGQKLQLERQLEAIQIQRDQFAIVQKQANRAEAIQQRAEKIQEKSAQIVGGARKMLIIILPIIIVLIAYVSWLILR